MNQILRLHACITLLLVIPVCHCCAFSSAASDPAANAPHLAGIDSIVTNAIQGQQVPGAVVLVWHDGKVLYRRAFGHRSLSLAANP